MTYYWPKINPTWKDGFSRSADESYYPHLWNGLVAAYSMGLGPTGASLYDFSGNKSDGTLENMDPDLDWVIDQGRYALDFDGSNDFVELTGESFDRIDKAGYRTGLITISAFINVTETFGLGQTPNFRVIAARGAHSDSQTSWLFTLDIDNNELEFVIDGGARRLTVSAGLSSNEWYHVAAVYDGATLYIYRDETLLGSQAETTGISTSTNAQARIGVDNAGTNRNFQGMIDDVFIWNRPIRDVTRYPLNQRGAFLEMRRKSVVSEQVAAAAGGPFPHFIKRSNELTGGMIGQGL